MSYFEAKMHQIQLRLGLRPDPENKTETRTRSSMVEEMNNKLLQYRQRKATSLLPLTEPVSVQLLRMLTTWHCPIRPPCSNRSIFPACRAHSSKPAAAAGWTDIRTDDRCTDPAVHTIRAVPIRMRISATRWIYSLYYTMGSEMCSKVPSKFSYPPGDPDSHLTLGHTRVHIQTGTSIGSVVFKAHDCRVYFKDSVCTPTTLRSYPLPLEVGSLNPAMGFRGAL